MFSLSSLSITVISVSRFIYAETPPLSFPGLICFPSFSHGYDSYLPATFVHFQMSESCSLPLKSVGPQSDMGHKPAILATWEADTGTSPSLSLEQEFRDLERTCLKIQHFFKSINNNKKKERGAIGSSVSYL